MSFYVPTATFFLLHCDEWDRVVALPIHKFVTGATLLQLGGVVYYKNSILYMIYSIRLILPCEAVFARNTKLASKVVKEVYIYTNQIVDKNSFSEIQCFSHFQFYSKCPPFSFFHTTIYKNVYIIKQPV